MTTRVITVDENGEPMTDDEWLRLKDTDVSRALRTVSPSCRANGGTFAVMPGKVRYLLERADGTREKVLFR